MAQNGLLTQPQSTRPRGARHGCDKQCRHRLRVSIHAPSWGATRDDRRDTSIERVSIHAPSWGATVEADKWKPITWFQSTRPRGARRPSCGAWCHPYDSFNPRALVGRDSTTTAHRPAPLSFNPRALVGRDC